VIGDGRLYEVAEPESTARSAGTACLMVMETGVPENEETEAAGGGGRAGGGKVSVSPSPVARCSISFSSFFFLSL
jgi:hypothetical protein